MSGAIRDPDELTKADAVKVDLLVRTMAFGLSREPPTHAALALACVTAALLVATHTSDAGMDEFIALLRYRVEHERSGKRRAAS